MAGADCISNWEWYISENTKLSQCHSLGGTASAERNLPLWLALPSEGFRWLLKLVKLIPFFLWEQSVPALSILDQVSLLRVPRKPRAHPHLKHLWQRFIMIRLYVCLPHSTVGAICFRTRSILFTTISHMTSRVWIQSRQS